MMDNKIVHILLVEDDENHAELVRRAFESRSEGVNLTVVGTLKDARARMEEFSPNLLIVDLRLPDGEGLKLLQGTREEAQFPVMVMTSHGDEQIAVEAMKAGALDYVVKTKETLTDMAHIADRALREWDAITRRKETEKLQDLQKNVLEKIVAGGPTIDILNTLCVYVETIVSPSVCSIMTLKEASCSLHILAAPNALEEWCSLLDGLRPGEQAGSCGTAAFTGEPVYVSDTQVDSRWAPFRDLAKQYGVLGCWSIPIYSEKQKVLGTFAISHPHPRAPTVFHQKLLETAAYLAGITIQKRAAEDKLLASEDQFRDLYDSAPLAYFSVAPDWNILMANSNAVELLGYSKEELLGRSVLELYAPTEHGQAKARGLQEKTIDGKEIAGQELEMQRADGSRLWVNLTLRLIHDAKGNLIERRGIVEDITLRKRVEKSLAQQKTILEMIALGETLPAILTRMCEIIEDQSPGLLCSIHLLEGTVLRNGAAPSLPETYIRKLDGIEIGPCVGSCGTAAFRKESVIVSDIATDPLWERGRRLALDHGLQACWSTPILTSDGSVLGTFAMYYRTPRTPTSEDLKLIATSTSLAGIAIEHRQAQENLQTSEVRYRALYEGNPTMYFTVSSDGTVLSVNQFGAEQLGYTVDELVGQSVFNIVYEEDRPKVQKQVMQCLQEPESLAHWEFRKVRKDGSLLWVRETARVVESSDHQPVMFIVCEDITVRRQAEDTLRAIVEGTAAVTSADFFRSLLRHLAKALKVPYAFIGECIDSTNTRVRTLAFLQRDTFVENVEYALEGTPCGEVISGKICYHPQEVQRLFPLNKALVDLGAQCYLGFPLRDSRDKVIGHLVIMSDQLVTFDTATESLLRIFAARAGAELERKQAEDTLRAIVEGTAAVTSADFVRSLLRHLAMVLQVPYTFIAECIDSTNTRVRTLAFLNRDAFVDNVEYDLEGTPCKDVIAGKICYHPEKLQVLFPRDQDLVDLGVTCYLGLPLRDSTDKVIGHLVIMSDQSVSFDTQTESLLKIFSARAGAELERMRAGQALQESNERLRALNIQLSAAEEAERKGIARELHDQFGQTLTLLKFELAHMAKGFTEKSVAPSAAPTLEKFQSMTELVDSTIHSVRNICSFLRPPILDDFGLLPALEWLGDDLQERTHLQCSVSIDPQLNQHSFTEAQKTTLFRIAQELMTNVIRHANASQVKLEFKIESNAFIIDVCDNGQGIREERLSGSGSFGLRGIRERAWLLGGDFHLQGQPEKGTTAKIRIPIDS